MEAITNIPAQKKSDAGKIVDVIEKGYTLGEKVLRYAKVVVANKNKACQKGDYYEVLGVSKNATEKGNKKGL